jgi:hypothetical protein
MHSLERYANDSCGIFIHLLHSQVPTDKPFRIVRRDPALDDIIAPDAKLEVLGEHFG